MQKYSVNIMWSDADANYVAVCPEFPGLSGLGATPAQAIAELEVVLELAIETYREEGWPLPEPKQSQHSGKMLLRMPKSLHARLAEQAEMEGVSLNTFVVAALSQTVGPHVSEKRSR